MPASKTKSTAYSLFVPLEAKTIPTYRRQYERLAQLMGSDLASRYFHYTDAAPRQVPDAQRLNPGHEVRELYAFMLRNQVPLDKMYDWILVSETEQRVIDDWCGSNLSLLSLTNRMIDFRREVWGELLLLLERKGQNHASRKSSVDRKFAECRSAL